ncbi:hypothetical protein SEA_ARACELI_34 [Streptomyces phage Araceli]|nr:hypothetical protein SEA_ARACELI_34 [Streptomyces phage Araceli]
MGAADRPVPENGDMGQDEQAALIRSTGDGVAVENEDEALREEWGEPENGVYAPNAEAREAFGEGERA